MSAAASTVPPGGANPSPEPGTQSASELITSQSDIEDDASESSQNGNDNSNSNSHAPSVSKQQSYLYKRMSTILTSDKSLSSSHGDVKDAQRPPPPSKKHGPWARFVYTVKEIVWLCRMGFVMLGYLGVVGKWCIMAMRLGLFAMFLGPAWCILGYTYFFSPHLKRGVRYGRFNRNFADLYIPPNANPAEPTCPVVVFISGGAWTIGYKAWGALLGIGLQRHGVITVSVDYRNFPQGRIGDMVDDGSNALSWVTGNIHKYGGDAGNMYLVGQSAGAHIVALLTMLKAKKEGEQMAEELNSYRDEVQPHHNRSSQKRLTKHISDIREEAELSPNSVADADMISNSQQGSTVAPAANGNGQHESRKPEKSRGNRRSRSNTLDDDQSPRTRTDSRRPHDSNGLKPDGSSSSLNGLAKVTKSPTVHGTVYSWHQVVEKLRDNKNKESDPTTPRRVLTTVFRPRGSHRPGQDDDQYLSDDEEDDEQSLLQASAEAFEDNDNGISAATKRPAQKYTNMRPTNGHAAHRKPRSMSTTTHPTHPSPQTHHRKISSTNPNTPQKPRRVVVVVKPKWRLSQIRCVVGVSGVYNLVDTVAHMETKGMPARMLYSIMSSSKPSESELPCGHGSEEMDEHYHHHHRGQSTQPLLTWSPSILAHTSWFKSVVHLIPPVLLIHGTADTTALWHLSEQYGRSLAAAGCRVAVKYYEGNTHTDPIIEGPMAGHDHLMYDVLAIVNRMSHHATKRRKRRESRAQAAAEGKDTDTDLSDTDSESDLAAPPATAGYVRTRSSTSDYVETLPDFNLASVDQLRAAYDLPQPKPIIPNILINAARYVNPF